MKCVLKDWRRSSPPIFWYNAYVKIAVISPISPISLTEGNLFSPSFFNSAKKNTNSLEETACWQMRFSHLRTIDCSSSLQVSSMIAYCMYPIVTGSTRWARTYRRSSRRLEYRSYVGTIVQASFFCPERICQSSHEHKYLSPTNYFNYFSNSVENKFTP